MSPPPPSTVCTVVVCRPSPFALGLSLARPDGLSPTLVGVDKNNCRKGPWKKNKPGDQVTLQAKAGTLSRSCTERNAMNPRTFGGFGCVARAGNAGAAAPINQRQTPHVFLGCWPTIKKCDKPLGIRLSLCISSSQAPRSTQLSTEFVRQNARSSTAGASSVCPVFNQKHAS